MSRGIPGRNAERAGRPSAIDLPLVAALAAIPLVLVVAHVPAPLLLPGIAAMAFTIAAIAAAFGWLTRADRGGDNVTIFDLAGACLLIGIGAGTFSDPHRVSQFFGAAIASP